MKPVFLFGSNAAGRHGKGAALAAFREHGAIMGQGRGLQGNSYAIPTKDYNIKTRPLADIYVDVREFIKFAEANPDMWFFVTRIGCGLAGYQDHQIAPMFKGAPDNCVFQGDWDEYLQD